MRAVIYSETGDSGVLKLVDRPEPEPGPGEVLVRVAVSGVNPTDWKGRRGDGPGQPLAFPEVVPNQDGAGTIDAVGQGVHPGRVGQRVWLWEAAWKRANGTAQEFVALPEHQAVPLPDAALVRSGCEPRYPGAHRASVSDGRSRAARVARPRHARGSHGARAGRRGCRRPRRDRARSLVGRDGHRHGEFGREGGPRLRRRRPPRRELPNPRSVGVDPADRAGGHRSHRRGRAPHERGARRGGDRTRTERSRSMRPGTDRYRSTSAKR